MRNIPWKEFYPWPLDIVLNYYYFNKIEQVSWIRQKDLHILTDYETIMIIIIIIIMIAVIG